ncbi:MAG: hypothetical protein FD180_2470 [Planctomycetota bacterium]|nr:MAG: hypothetical protein FD180_2470 [Planctomycetota bacterium]
MLDLSSVPDLPSNPVRALSRLTTVVAVAPMLALVLFMPCLPLPASTGWTQARGGIPGIRRLNRPQLEVLERLRRLKSATSMPDVARAQCFRETWLEFRSNAVDWEPPLLRRALSVGDPLRYEAIIALRFYGTEQAWEHHEHSRSPSCCLLGKESGRDQAEATLRAISRKETGAERRLALESLGSFRTGSAVEFLVAELREDGDCETIDAALESIKDGDWMSFDGGTPLTWSDRPRVVRRWRDWWQAVIDGREEFPGVGTLPHERIRYWK